jgi:hypothetical protein
MVLIYIGSFFCSLLGITILNMDNLTIVHQIGSFGLVIAPLLAIIMSVINKIESYNNKNIKESI